MATTMKPYGDEEQSLQVGGLTIENGTERINLSGSLDLNRDKQALEHAKALRSALDSIISALEAERNLPATAETQVAKTTTAKNPFA